MLFGGWKGRCITIPNLIHLCVPTYVNDGINGWAEHVADETSPLDRFAYIYQCNRKKNEEGNMPVLKVIYVNAYHTQLECIMEYV